MWSNEGPTFRSGISVEEAPDIHGPTRGLADVHQHLRNIHNGVKIFEHRESDATLRVFECWTLRVVESMLLLFRVQCQESSEPFGCCMVGLNRCRICCCRTCGRYHFQERASWHRSSNSGPSFRRSQSSTDPATNGLHRKIFSPAREDFQSLNSHRSQTHPSTIGKPSGRS